MGVVESGGNLGGNYPMQSGGTYRRTVRTDIQVVCPVCKKLGWLVVRKRGENHYGYVYHGYEKGKKIEHYIGKCPKPGTPEFERWVRDVERKMIVRLEIPGSLYEQLERYVTDIPALIIKLLEDYVARMKGERLAEALESMQRASPPNPGASPASRRPRATSGGPQGQGGEWRWWEAAKRKR